MQATESSRIILLSGIPATGKSYFGQWLHLNHGFMHIDLEDPFSRRSAGIYDAWEDFISTNEVEPLIHILHETASNIVIDWGFPPEELRLVIEFQKAGVELWWFEGDTSVASSQFIQRDTRPIQQFYSQVPGIRLTWPAISEVFGTNCIKVLEQNSPRLSCEEIWGRMNPSLLTS